MPGETLEEDGQIELRKGSSVCGEPRARSAQGCVTIDFCVPHQEARVLSGALEASKALLEEHLEAARDRCARLHQTQRENLVLHTRLGEALAVRRPGDPCWADLLLLSL